MESFRNRAARIVMLVTSLIMICPMFAFAEEAGAEEPALYATAWAIVPPVAAILLALITKEVYSSLFIGVVIGGVLYAGSFEGTLTHVISDGIVGSLSDAYNVGILVFLVILGVIVALLNKSGGSKAFGVWASKRIKTKTGAQLATIVLGILIFVDDYFNCLTVGSVMSPLAEANGVNRTKLAYLIDATAAPVCIIAPISSWAAAVTGFVEGENGFTLFIQAIPFNFYALLTIAMMFLIVGMKFDYAKMREYADKIQEQKADDFFHNADSSGCVQSAPVGNDRNNNESNLNKSVLKRYRNPNIQNFAKRFFLWAETVSGKRKSGLLTFNGNQCKQNTARLGKCCAKRSTGSSQMEKSDKQIIQYNIHCTCNCDEIHRTFRIPQSTENRTDHIIRRNKRNPEKTDRQISCRS